MSCHGWLSHEFPTLGKTKASYSNSSSAFLAYSISPRTPQHGISKQTFERLCLLLRNPPSLFGPFQQHLGLSSPQPPSVRASTILSLKSAWHFCCSHSLPSLYTILLHAGGSQGISGDVGFSKDCID